jgi:cell division protein ZapD
LVLYEFPLNERIRVFMRLEQLFQQTNHFMEGDSIWDSRAVISSLLEIVAIFSRNDLKSEILKELDRHSSIFNKMLHHQDIDQDKLTGMLSRLGAISEELYATPGKIGLPLMESDLCKSISQRNSIPGGTYAFDLPAYHFWLQQNESHRRKDLERWLRPFSIIRTAIDLLLTSIRQSASPSSERAENGFFQKTLDHSLPFQLLQVGVDRSLPYFAEISGGKHRFTIRFMATNAHDRATQTDQEIPFQLSCCLL